MYQSAAGTIVAGIGVEATMFFPTELGSHDFHKLAVGFAELSAKLYQASHEAVVRELQEAKANG